MGVIKYGEQVVQRGSEVVILGGNQNVTGHSQE